MIFAILVGKDGNQKVVTPRASSILQSLNSPSFRISQFAFIIENSQITLIEIFEQNAR
jgi:hypothetical protein